MFSRDLTELLVLAAIEEMESQTDQQITAYAITKNIKQKFGEIWNASPGTIYPLLEKLTDLGDLAAETINDKAQNAKKIYKTTEQGKQRLKESSKEFIQSAFKAVPNIFMGFKKFYPLGAIRFEIPKHFDFDDWIFETEESNEDIPTISRIQSLEQQKQLLQDLKQNYIEKIRKIDEKIGQIDEKIKIIKEIKEKQWVRIPIRDDLEET